MIGRSHVLQPELHVRGKNRPGNPLVDHENARVKCMKVWRN